MNFSLNFDLAKTRLHERFKSATYCNQEIFSLTHYHLTHLSLTNEKNSPK